MDALMTGQMYSVDVEMENGSRTVVQVEAESSSEAYRQARETPGVRRVGRVTEGIRHTHSSSQTASRPSVREEKVSRPGNSAAHQQQAPEAPLSPQHRGQLLGNMISGPRIVRDARVLGGERPFAHLQPPPPRVEPVRPPPKLKAKARARAAAEAAAAAAAVEVAAPQPAPVAAVPPAAPGTDYRIVKSRRKDGQPYLLQRGTWTTQGTKRTFAAQWEKGFDTREQAEKHQAWVIEMAAQSADVAN
jgi:hypothetical protein